MLTTLSTIKTRLAIDEFDLTYDTILTNAINAIKVGLECSPCNRGRSRHHCERPMEYAPYFPLDITPEEQATGFRRMVLSIGDYVGPWPGQNLEVAARRLSASDVLIKRRHTTGRGECTIYYEHLRFGHKSWRDRIRSIRTDLKFGCWRSWLRVRWPWRTDWQYLPHGHYDSPTDDCSRTLSYAGVIGFASTEFPN